MQTLINTLKFSVTAGAWSAAGFSCARGDWSVMILFIIFGFVAGTWNTRRGPQHG